MVAIVLIILLAGVLAFVFLLRSIANKERAAYRAAYRSKAAGLVSVMAVLARVPAKTVNMDNDKRKLGELAMEAVSCGLYELPEFEGKKGSVLIARDSGDAYRRLCLAMGLEDGDTEVFLDVLRYRLARDIEREILDAIDHTK